MPRIDPRITGEGRGARGYHGHVWTDDDKKLVAELIEKGHSGGQIAASMPFRCTRNMILGIADRARLGKLKGSRAGAAAPKKPRAKPEAKPAPKPIPKAAPNGIAPWNEKRLNLPPNPLPPAPEVEPDMLMVALPNLQTHQCKYPVREAANVIGGFLFCARAVGVGEIYCEWHRANVVQAGTARRAR